MVDDLISWCGAPSTTAADLLRRAKDHVAMIARQGAEAEQRQERAKPYPADPAEQVEWLKERERWRRNDIGDKVMPGLQLPRLPWGPPVVGLIAELCAFALASLERIDALYRRACDAESDAVDWKRKHGAATEAARVAALAATASLKAAENDAAHSLDVARSIAADLRARLAAAEADGVQARQEARDAGRDRDVAVAQADAWRASAAAAQDALHIMRTALRIPAREDEAGLVVRPQR